jgi:hypothetical protein
MTSVPILLVVIIMMVAPMPAMVPMVSVINRLSRRYILAGLLNNRLRRLNVHRRALHIDWRWLYVDRRWLLYHRHAHMVDDGAAALD